MTRRQGARSFDELVGILNSKADARFTPPGEGPEAPLTDVLVHGLDIRWPLGLSSDIPDERAVVALNVLAKTPAGVVPKGALNGLRFEATDLGWTHGVGPTVAGLASALMLAMTGRGAVVNELTGDGAEILSTRIAS